ncbi:protein PIH1D3 [Syngnathoides biaculeatus]|uniref:protein PIH1D3 n=1 Tax=Syngnathoides biaculeatus TaxID=300417 RepID=UPI002ADD9C7F|nr:protein PIH1D3 [Syngnathoides biaculeatus]
MEYHQVSSLQNIQALSALLSTQQDDDDDDYQDVSPYAKMGPGHIGPPAKKEKEESSPYEKKNSKDVWSEEEVPEGPQYDDVIDPRPQPEYEIILKQSVCTEDLFLGLSRKDPSSMCCEGMLVKIKLPDSKLSDVTLDVKEKFLDLRTPKYRLGLHLPHPVHHQEGKAQFFSEREELEVTLAMNRPLDAVNMQ